jgi:hypothetical protein
MPELRLSWEPENLSEQTLIASQVLKYMDGKATFAQFSNGTCLMLKPIENLEETIQGVMREARRIVDFKVYKMEDEDFLVCFASPLFVYVGKGEFASQFEKIKIRFSELLFPSESIVPMSDLDDDTVMVGLYARGKLQRDAWQSSSYVTVTPP